MTYSWMFPWIVSIIVTVYLTSRWRHTRIVAYLYTSYAVSYLFAVALVLFWWTNSASRWWSIFGAVYLAATLPLFLWMHRREVRKYGPSVR